MIIHNGKELMRISKWTCNLEENRALANQQLRQYLALHGCTPSKHTPVFWKHYTTDNMFTLVVDDFGVKHLSKSKAEHLIQALKDKFEGTQVNWEEKNYAVSI